MVNRRRFLAMCVALAFFHPDKSRAGNEKKLVALQAMLYAKMLFLDYDVRKKLVNKKARFVVVYDTPEHARIAKLFVQALQGKEVMGTPIEAVAIPLERLSDRPRSAVIAVLEPDRLAKIAASLQKEGRLLFGYDVASIPYVAVTIEIGTRIVPYINPSVLREAGIQMRPILFKVAKVYDHADRS
jgi:hypothetical protein